PQATATNPKPRPCTPGNPMQPATGGKPSPDDRRRKSFNSHLDISPGASMRLATVVTLNGPRAVAIVNERYVDLAATDPGLPTCMKHVLSASPAIRRAIEDAAANPKAVSY